MSRPMFTDNAKTVLRFLQANKNADLTLDTIAEGTGFEPKSVNGILISLQKEVSGHGRLVERVEVEGMDKKVIRLTDEGLVADPEAMRPEAE